MPAAVIAIALATLLAATAAGVCAAPASGATSAATGLQTDVIFSDYSPLSANAELLRRLLSPLARAQVEESLGRSGEKLVPQSIDLAAEQFVLYVPSVAPPGGYGLLVFVPPWQDARLPTDWGPVLDRAGLIYVSAAHSGNEENVLGRREPLAILAAYNVMQHYPVDAARVYVGGFSGGSHIALRLALAFPDLFRGALLNAGSDPLGSGVPPLPPADLFQRFQESTRLVYVTGEHDSRLALDAASQQSMHQWCVFDTEAQGTLGAGHEIASAAALSRALEALLVHKQPDAAKLARCRADVDRDVASALQKARSLAEGGKRTEAHKALIELDRRFGGLAAPRSVEIEAALNSPGAGGH
jgi:dienelactone hydrolase